MARQETPGKPVLLTSWKEIASYLGKGVRTVQRWEAEFALPVRRPEGDRHIVRAVAEELDAWLERWSQKYATNEQAGRTTRSPESSVYVQASRQLRTEQRALVSELKKSVSDLTHQCEAMGVRLTHNTVEPLENVSPRTARRK